jgi:hypothetical protein
MTMLWLGWKKTAEGPEGVFVRPAEKTRFARDLSATLLSRSVICSAQERKEGNKAKF